MIDHLQASIPKLSLGHRTWLEKKTSRYVSVVDDAALQADVSGALSTLLEAGWGNGTMVAQQLEDS